MKDWLRKVEKEYDIDILFACEAGSKAWGYASSLSDDDLRFIFKYRDQKRYLSMDQPGESIDFRSPIDAQGWDIRKAFRLLRKANPSLFEWAYSPVIYVDRNGFRGKLQEMIQIGYSSYSLGKHYLSLAKRNIKECETNHFNRKQQKQLLYSFRAIIIIKGLTKGNGLTGELIPDQWKQKSSFITPELNGFQQIRLAMQNDAVISEAERIVLLELANLLMESLSVKIDDLDKGRDLTEQLNEWLWELLEVKE